MQVAGVGAPIVDRFEDHAGFEGVMLAFPAADYHLEFTACRRHAVAPTPTVEDLQLRLRS